MTMNRFILVPEDIYRGLTSSDTGNINLDYTKRMLENVKKEKTNPETKNVRYNQELRRYLHLKKEHEEKPVKVEISGTPNIPTSTSQSGTMKQNVNIAPPVQPTPKTDLTNEFLMRINVNPDKYSVTTDGKIKNEHGKIIEGSNVKKSLNWIISNESGLKSGPRPKGTTNIENLIKRDKVLLQMLQNINPPATSSLGTPPQYSTPKSEFKPSQWK